MMMMKMIIYFMGILVMVQLKISNLQNKIKCTLWLLFIIRLNIGSKDFEFQKVLGVGGFGAVWLVQKLGTNDRYAMKVIDCSKEGNYLSCLKVEKNVFEILEGDFVVKAYYSFIEE